MAGSHQDSVHVLFKDIEVEPRASTSPAAGENKQRGETKRNENQPVPSSSQSKSRMPSLASDVCVLCFCLLYYYVCQGFFVCICLFVSLLFVLFCFFIIIFLAGERTDPQVTMGNDPQVTMGKRFYVESHFWSTGSFPDGHPM